MATLQEDVQAAIRVITGTAQTYEGDWQAYLDALGIDAGSVDGRRITAAQRLDSTIGTASGAHNYFLQNGQLAIIEASAPFYAPRTSSITQTRGSGTPTETRATTATVMGYAAGAVLADGQTLLTVASGELRHQGARRISEGVWSTVDANGVPIPAATLDGSVVEAAATNLCLQSNAFTTTWTAGGTPAATQNVTGPDGVSNSAWTLTDNDASAVEVVSQAVTLTAAAYTYSIFVKKTTGAQSSYPVVWFYTGLNTALATIDTSNGIATCWTAYTGQTILSGASATCASFNDDYWRVSITATGTVAAYTFAFAPSATTNATQSTGVFNTGAQGANVFYGAQVELGSYATAYIPTTTAAATRNKDVLDDQVASNVTAAAGSVAFQWTPSHAPSGTIALAGSYVDASNYTALLHDGTKYILRKRIAASNYDATLTAAFVSGTTYDIALQWGASGSNLAVDGVLGTPHANTDPAQLGTRWQWLADGNGGQQAGAAIKEKFMWTRALSDSELIAVAP